MDTESSTAACADFHKDFGLPNTSWKKEMMDLYEKFMEQTKSGTWKRLPSYIRGNNLPFYIRELTVEHKKPERCSVTGPATEPSSQYETRFFTRNLDVEGTGLEYVLFSNLEDKRLVGLFQIGPYLEGHPGLSHGGCIATIIDLVTGICAYCAVGNVFTASLTINYRNSVPLGSVVVAESHVNRIEGRKVFLSVCIRSADDAILFTEATGLFIIFNNAHL